MRSRHSMGSIVSMAVLSMGLAALLHEGLGHGVTAWLRGVPVTELTSNHLSSNHPDRLVAAAGTIVNLIAAAFCLWGYRQAGGRTNLKYFCWLFGAVNVLDGAGYFLYSGIIGVGDWEQVIAGLPHQVLLRIAMSIFGASFYWWAVKLIVAGVRPFVAVQAEYNVVARLPYLAACVFYCIAGAFDPLGVQLLVLSTIPAAFGGLSGLAWGDSMMPPAEPREPLTVRPSRTLWVTAAVFGCAFVAVLGRGIQFGR